MRRGFVLSSALVLAAACGSFDEAPDTSGPPADAGIDSAAASVDGGARDDAALGPDAQDAGCGHTFCADFETDPIGNGFTDEVTTNPAIELSLIDAMPGRALRARIPSGTYGTASNRYLRKKIVGTARNALFLFRVRVVKQPAGVDLSNSVQVATLGWGPEDTKHDRLSEIQVRIAAGTIFTRRDEGANDANGGTVPLTGTWMDVVVAVNFQPAKSTNATVTINGTPSVLAPFTSESDPTDIEIGVGAAGVDNDQQEIIYDIDDVRLDVTQ